MDTMSAFIQGQLNKDNPQRVFDWFTAARLIRERQVNEASAGLSGDWEWTGGEIYRNGHPVPADETYWPDEALAVLRGES